MGMAASQARLLMLTARIHDTEYQAQQIQSAKLQLATQEDEVYRKYNEALDATTLTFRNDKGSLIPANFNNLCGVASISNGLYKSFVFRTGDNDKLIVPDEVYEGYKNYGGNNAYEFAMYMLGVDPEELSEAEDAYLNDITANETVPSDISDLRNAMKEKLSNLETIMGQEGYAKCVEEGQDLELPNESAPNYEEAKKVANEYLSLKEKYTYKLYQKGAEGIFSKASKDSGATFDQEKFNYYQRWGMLIENEISLDYCISESYYSEDFGTNGELLQQMLQSGRITVDEVSMDTKEGKLEDKTTSVATDDSLDYTTTSTIDKTALAKAEAEYEFAMKKINQKDKKYDMELNKLETERTALTKEYDSVKKVIQDNIERSFGIFS